MLKMNVKTPLATETCKKFWILMSLNQHLSNDNGNLHIIIKSFWYFKLF